MDHTPVDPQFVLEHAAHVRALAGRLVFDGTRADDLEQETWLAALKNAPRSMTSPRGWLARIAQRRAAHDWRAESRRAAREHEVARAESVTSSEEILEREETRAELVRAVLALEDPYRAALVAQFLEERTPSEAARRRGIPVETQRTHVKRALELLRERLKRSHGAAFGAFQLALVRDLRLEAPLGTTFVAAGSGLWIGGLSMGTAKKVAAVVLVALAAWIGLARPWGAVDAPMSVGADVAEVRLASPTEVARPAAPAERAVIAANVEGAVAASPASANPASAVVVVARIVDENGRPIAGASGALASSTGSWNETTPRGETFRGTSDGDGVLRIDAPHTTSTSVELTIDAGPWRTRLKRSFDAEKLDRIVPGTNDAGELMLRPAGRVRGRLTADGAPVPDARVQATSPVWTGAWMAASSTSDGRFQIDSVDPSVNELQVTLRGSSMRVAVVRIVVRAGVENDAGEIALQPALTIQGRVTDKRGEPIANVVVRAQRVLELRSEPVTTASDGTFVVRATEAGDYDLSVAASQFVHAWADNDTPAARFTTGEIDARIVLERVPATTFRVVAEDGTPVLDFGLGVRPIAPVRRSAGSATTASNTTSNGRASARTSRTRSSRPRHPESTRSSSRRPGSSRSVFRSRTTRRGKPSRRCASSTGARCAVASCATAPGSPTCKSSSSARGSRSAPNRRRPAPSRWGTRTRATSRTSPAARAARSRTPTAASNSRAWPPEPTTCASPWAATSSRAPT